MSILLYIFLLSAFFLFLKKIGKNVEYRYIYGIYRIGKNLKFLEKISKSKIISIFEYSSFFVGFVITFIAILFILYGLKERIPTVVPVIPGLEIYGIRFPIFEVIFAIFVSALVHELAHALLIIRNNVPIKSFGIFFLGPFLGAFVEPSDEIFKLSKIKQIAIFNAGIFANILLSAFIFIFLFNWNSEVYIVGKVPNITKIENILIEGNEKVLYIAGREIRRIADIREVLRYHSPGDIIEIVTEKNKYVIELSEKDGKPFIGLYFEQRYKFQFLYNLLFWIFVISSGIGLGNSLPIFSLDGGQSFRALLSITMKDEKKISLIHSIVSYIIIAIIILNIFLLF